MPAGRPRTLAPQESEVVELGEDLVIWATEETSELRTTWSFWYALKHGMIEANWKALKKFPEFRPYYEIARASLAQKIHNQQLEKGMCHRYIRLYDRQLAELEDTESLSKYEKELHLKKDIEKEQVSQVDGRLLELLEALKKPE